MFCIANSDTWYVLKSYCKSYHAKSFLIKRETVSLVWIILGTDTLVIGMNID